MANSAQLGRARRIALASTLALSLGLGLAACSSSDKAAEKASEAVSSATSAASDASAAASSAAVAEALASSAIDKAAFDALVASGPVADDATIASSEWAQKIKENGVLRVGGTRTSYLFSLLDETDGQVRGLDAGLYELLTRYILGDQSKVEYVPVDATTREAVLQTGQADAVFATYSITDERSKVISFAGPYYTSQKGVLVKANNTDINSYEDLKDATVAAQAGSTGPAIIEEYIPGADVQEFDGDTEARKAVEQGRVDAYVNDYTLLLNALAKNPGSYRIAGDAFGPVDPYGIGLPLDSDGVQFVNDFLKQIIADGTWEQLWHISIGDRTGVANAPEAPVIN